MWRVGRQTVKAQETYRGCVQSSDLHRLPHRTRCICRGPLVRDHPVVVAHEDRDWWARGIARHWGGLWAIVINDLPPSLWSHSNGAWRGTRTNPMPRSDANSPGSRKSAGSQPGSLWWPLTPRLGELTATPSLHNPHSTCNKMSSITGAERRARTGACDQVSEDLCGAKSQCKYRKIKVSRCRSIANDSVSGRRRSGANAARGQISSAPGTRCVRVRCLLSAAPTPSRPQMEDCPSRHSARRRSQRCRRVALLGPDRVAPDRLDPCCTH